MSSFSTAVLETNTENYVTEFLQNYLATDAARTGSDDRVPPTFWHDEGVSMTSFSGNSTITTGPTTTEVLFIFDPLMSVRTSDYFELGVYEYDSARTLVGYRRVQIGGALTNHLAAAVVDARVSVIPMSPSDFASGAMTGAKLTVRPRDFITLTSNEISRLVGDTGRDLVSNIHPTDGGIKGQMMAPDLGSDLVFVDKSSMSHLRVRNVIFTVSNPTAGTAGGVYGEAIGDITTPGNGFTAFEFGPNPSNNYFGCPQDKDANVASPQAALAAYLDRITLPPGGAVAGNRYSLFDSMYISDAENPLNSLVNSAKMTLRINAGPESIIRYMKLTYTMIALDSANQILDSSIRTCIIQGGGNGQDDVGSNAGHFDFFCSSRKGAIKRVVILFMAIDWNDDFVPIGELFRFYPTYHLASEFYMEDVGYSTKPYFAMNASGVNPGAVFSINADVSAATRRSFDTYSVAPVAVVERPPISASLARALLQQASLTIPSIIPTRHVPAVQAASYDGLLRASVAAMSFKTFGKALHTASKIGKNPLVKGLAKATGTEDELEMATKVAGAGSKLMKGGKHHHKK